MGQKQTQTDAFPEPDVPISPKRVKFVLELMQDENQVQAYIRAGYSASKASKSASRLAANVGVAAYIAQCREFLREKYAVTAERTIEELGRIAFASAETFFTFGSDGVTLNDSANIDARNLAAVKSVSQTVTAHGGTIRLELHSKVAALDLLMQHFGLLETKAPKDPEKMSWPDLIEEFAADAKREGITLQ